MKDRAYEFELNRRYDGYTWGLAIMMYKIFDEKTGSGTTSKREVNCQLNNYTKKWLKIQWKKIVYEFTLDLAEMGSLSSKTRGTKYLFCVIDVFPK